MPQSKAVNGPQIDYPSISDLTPTEKDRLLSAILYHLGRRPERVKWDGEADGSINLARERA